MTYSIVVATRNRLPALRLSIPRMVDQTCPPRQLIVVDSSDGHQAVVDTIHRSVGSRPIQTTILHSERGLCLQRNRGLEIVTEPLVLFPDDDSIWYPSVAETIVSTYAQDKQKLISAVCAAEATTPPKDFPWEQASYKMANTDRCKRKFSWFKTRLENALIPDPCRILGRSFFPSWQPEWFRSAEVVPVESMTGFRMSFRTEVIRQVGFDTSLKRYSLYEDRDASFGAWKHGLVVAARKAKVFHYKSPERRDAGRRIGVENILNLAYVIAKHTPLHHPSRKHLSRFCRYKAFLYLLSSQDAYGRESYQGAKTALAELPSIRSAPPELAAKRYREAILRCLPETNDN